MGFSIRKYTKTKSFYLTDEALMKSVYLSLKEATRKWTGRIPRWGEIYSQLRFILKEEFKQDDKKYHPVPYIIFEFTQNFGHPRV